MLGAVGGGEARRQEGTRRQTDLQRTVRRRHVMALLVSLAWHALVIAAVLSWSLPAPLSFERLDPGEVEFSVVSVPEDEAPAEAPSVDANAEVAEGEDAPSEDSEPAAPARVRDRSEAAQDQAAADPPSEPPTPNPSERIKAPPTLTAHQGGIAGNSVVLRVDMRAMRASIVRDAFEAALVGLEDWDLLLGGAGVSPVRDTDALIIASPDMSLERTLIVGRANLGPERLREVAERLARRRGDPSLSWAALPDDMQAQTLPPGIEVARWFSRDPTSRHIAVVPPSGFVIATLRDLSGGLALLGRDPAARPATETPFPGAFDLPKHALLGLRVEDLSLFVRLRGVPTPTVSFAALIEQGTERFRLDAQADFADGSERDVALAALRERLERYRFHPLLRFAGFASLLDEARLEAAEDTSVRLTIPLTYRDLLRLLALLPRRADT